MNNNKSNPDVTVEDRVLRPGCGMTWQERRDLPDGGPTRTCEYHVNHFPEWHISAAGGGIKVSIPSAGITVNMTDATGNGAFVTKVEEVSREAVEQLMERFDALCLYRERTEGLPIDTLPRARHVLRSTVSNGVEDASG